MIHIEGWDNEVENEESFRVHAEAVREFATMLEDHGLSGTFEARPEFFDACDKWDDNVMLELYERGHAIGVHADSGYSQKKDVTQEIFEAEIKDYKDGLEELTGVEIRHVSGICSELDWVEAATNAGYEFMTGGVAYCVMSMDTENIPEEFKDCESPSSCHDTFPTDLEDRMTPVRVNDGSTWLYDTRGDLVVFHSSSVVYHLGEDSEDLGEDDIEAYFEQLNEALGLVEEGRVNILYHGWSIGSNERVSNNDELYDLWFSELEPYLESGQVEWKTIPGMYDNYLSWEDEGWFFN